MIDIRVDIDEAQIKEIKKRLGNLKGKAPVVLYRAINSAASSTRAKMGQETARRYNISSKTVKESVSVKKASKSSLKAYVISRGGPVGIENYSFKMGDPPTVAVKKGAPKPIGENPRAFMTTVTAAMIGRQGGSHEGYFQRYKLSHKKAKKRSTRKPGKASELNMHNVNIHRFSGPAIPSIVKNEETMDALRQNAVERLEKRIDAEVNNILKRGC